jgi:hypothetical protein
MAAHRVWRTRIRISPLVTINTAITAETGHENGSRIDA